jgi:hypothetical protein
MQQRPSSASHGINTVKDADTAGVVLLLVLLVLLVLPGAVLLHTGWHLTSSRLLLLRAGPSQMTRGLQHTA